MGGVIQFGAGVDVVKGWTSVRGDRVVRTQKRQGALLFTRNIWP